MKKVLTLGLIIVLVLGIGMVSFAHYGSSRDTYDNAQGFRPGMMYGRDNTVIDSLSELTGLTELELYQSGLPIHIIADENDVLDEFLDLSLENRIERIEDLVENGNITEAYGELIIGQITEMREYQKTEDATFGNNENFRGGGYCGRRW